MLLQEFSEFRVQLGLGFALHLDREADQLALQIERFQNGGEVGMRSDRKRLQASPRHQTIGHIGGRDQRQ
jgi:hypothetical protein